MIDQKKARERSRVYWMTCYPDNGGGGLPIVEAGSAAGSWLLAFALPLAAS